MIRAKRHGALVAIGQAAAYVQGIALACYSLGGPTDGHRLFTALSVCSHWTPWGYTTKLFRSVMLIRYKELKLGL